MGERTSLTSFTVLALLGLLSGSILGAVAGIPVIGAFAGLILGVILVGAGVKTFDFDIEEVEDVGGTLVSVGILVLGAQYVLQALNLNVLGFVPSWLGLGFAGLGLVLVNWHWAESLLKI